MCCLLEYLLQKVWKLVATCAPSRYLMTAARHTRSKFASMICGLKIACPHHCPKHLETPANASSSTLPSLPSTVLCRWILKTHKKDNPAAELISRRSRGYSSGQTRPFQAYQGPSVVIGYLRISSKDHPKQTRESGNCPDQSHHHHQKVWREQKGGRVALLQNNKRHSSPDITDCHATADMYSR